MWSILPISCSLFLRYASLYASPNPEPLCLSAFFSCPLRRTHIVADPSGKCEAAGEAPHGRLNFSPIWIFERRYVTRQPGWARSSDFVHNFLTDASLIERNIESLMRFIIYFLFLSFLFFYITYLVLQMGNQ